MTLKTGAKRCSNRYKTNLLSCHWLTLQPWTYVSNLVIAGLLEMRFCGSVIRNPSESFGFINDSTTTAGLKIRQNLFPPTGNRVVGIMSLVYKILFLALIDIGVFMNHMDLKSAIRSCAQARYLVSNHFFNSHKVFIPGAMSPLRHCLVELELISSYGPYSFGLSMTRSVPKPGGQSYKISGGCF